MRNLVIVLLVLYVLGLIVVAGGYTYEGAVVFFYPAMLVILSGYLAGLSLSQIREGWTPVKSSFERIYAVILPISSFMFSCFLFGGIFIYNPDNRYSNWRLTPTIPLIAYVFVPLVLGLCYPLWYELSRRESDIAEL